MTTYRIAGIDVHKKMLAVAVADIAVEGSIGSRAGGSAPVRVSCASWRRGWTRRPSRKW